MKHYKVKWVVPSRIYIPPNEAGGGYYSDYHGVDIIYASSAKEAKRVVQVARPETKRFTVTVL